MNKHLESALAKLCAHVLSDDHYPYAVISRKEAAALLARLSELEEQLSDGNCPVKYYKHGGVTYAVYGTSSINHAEMLLAKIGAAEKALQLAASTFRRYEALHAAKPDPVKAASNAALAQQMEEALAAYRNPQPAGGGEKSGEFAPAPPDKTYQHALVRRLWEAQLGDLPDDVKRLMAEAATEIEGNLPATDDFVNSMRRKHAKVIR